MRQASRQHEIQVVLVYERTSEEGKAIAAVAWLGEDMAIVPARDAPTGAVGLVRSRLGKAIGESIKRMAELRHTSEVRKVVAQDTGSAARMVLKDEGLLA